MNLARVPTMFWVVAIAGLLWNLFGLMMFWQNLMMTPEAIAALPDAQRQISQANPRWTLVPFAIATGGGVLGTLLMLLRRRAAVLVLLLSLLALVVQFSAIYLATPVWVLTGVSGAMFPVVLWIIAAALWLYARHAVRRGWLR